MPGYANLPRCIKPEERDWQREREQRVSSLWSKGERKHTNGTNIYETSKAFIEAGRTLSGPWLFISKGLIAVCNLARM